MPDPVILISMLLLAALVEWSPRRLVPIGAVLAVGVVLADQATDQVGVIALAGAVGVALASLATALEARRGRKRAQQSSPFAQAQREAIRARLSGSGALARISFTMAALPGPTGKMLYPMLGAMRAPLLPALVGTIIGRTITLTVTTTIFTWIARSVSNNDSGAAEFLVTAIVLLMLLRAINWVDWEHRSATGSWRLRESGADPLSARMFMGGAPGASGAGFPDATTHGHAHAADDDDVLEGDVIGEEILDADDDQLSGDEDSSSRGALPSGS